MAPAETWGTPAFQFTDQFGWLVVLLRREPGNVLAQKLALRRALATLKQGPFVLEPGITYSEVPDETSFQGRLLLRRIETIEFAPDAPPGEVLDLARALASDTAPLPSSEKVQARQLSVERAGNDVTPARLAPVDGSSDLTPSGRSRTMAGPVAESEKLARVLEASATQGHWMEALHAAQALVRLIPRFPDHERRGYLIGLRRLFGHHILEEFIFFAMRATEEQARVSEVLNFAGPEALELMVEHACRSEAIGPRRFIHDMLAATPEAVPLLLPLLHSSRWHEVRHAATLLGRIGVASAISPLRATLGHPEAKVRQAVVEALARFSENSVVEPIRQALGDASPGTRASAAHALARRNSPALAMPILAALETEKDPEAWSGLVNALARIESAESIGTLVTLALDRRPMFGTGRPMSLRLMAVKALADARSPVATNALDQLAREADGPVRRAAEAALKSAPG